VNETSASLYLTPNLVNMSVARTAPLTLLPHLQKMLPEVVAGDPTATRVFLAESLKAEATGKGTSTKDMTETGVWSARDVKAATAERGREDAETFVAAAVAFIERWKVLRPTGTK
jgi:creatinine amidohydrolase/Fe(II)-dependent formamide hydrolase-like protein